MTSYEHAIANPGKRLLYPGAPCTCRPGRYVRFVDPPGVPGLEPAIHCRAVGAPEAERRTHDIPPDAVVLIHVPTVDPRGLVGVPYTNGRNRKRRRHG